MADVTYTWGLDTREFRQEIDRGRREHREGVQKIKAETEKLDDSFGRLGKNMSSGLKAAKVAAVGVAGAIALIGVALQRMVEYERETLQIERERARTRRDAVSSTGDILFESKVTRGAITDPSLIAGARAGQPFRDAIQQLADAQEELIAARPSSDQELAFLFRNSMERLGSNDTIRGLPGVSELFKSMETRTASREETISELQRLMQMLVQEQRRAVQFAREQAVLGDAVSRGQRSLGLRSLRADLLGATGNTEEEARRRIDIGRDQALLSVYGDPSLSYDEKRIRGSFIREIARARGDALDQSFDRASIRNAATIQTGLSTSGRLLSQVFGGPSAVSTPEEKLRESTDNLAQELERTRQQLPDLLDEIRLVWSN